MICILCGWEIEGYGNNPAPLAQMPSKCCDECNVTKVIPVRLIESIIYKPNPISK